MILHNPIRLHARPAALLVAQAAKSKSNVTILFNDKMINAKSMFQIEEFILKQLVLLMAQLLYFLQMAAPRS